MVVIANREELDWLFDALSAEEASGAPVADRMSCGEMQRAVIRVVVTVTTAQLKQGERNAGEE